jgi:hypothetical protein
MYRLYIIMTYAPKKKQYKPKNYKRNRKAIISTVPRYSSSPAKFQLAKLVWVGTKEIISASGQTVYPIELQPNNLYDISPDITGTQQSLYRDQMFNLYGAARVTSFQIDIESVATTSLPCDMCLAPFDAGFDTDMNIAKQRKGAKYNVQNINQRSFIKTYSSVDGYFGRKKGFTVTDDTSKQVAGIDLMSTNNRCQYELLIRDMLGTQPVGNKFAIVTIKVTQYVRFEEPLQVAAS